MQNFSVTQIVVIITCLVSALVMSRPAAKSALLFHPVSIANHRQWYRFLSSGFIHADWVHLAINMFVLWSFGTAVERHFYPEFLGDSSVVKYLALYLGGIAFASLPSFLRYRQDSAYAALGASGGVAAVVFAVILFEPWQNLYLYGVIAIPQILAGIAYLAYSWYSDKRATDNIGHMAHFSGALWGLGFTIAMNPSLLPRFLEKTLAGPAW